MAMKVKEGENGVNFVNDVNDILMLSRTYEERV